MLILHHLENSRSLRILWLLEELGCPYEIKSYDRDANQLAPRELRQIHPIGKAPVITDGEITLAESGAIIEYLIEKYGNGRFKTSSDVEYAQNLYYSHYAEGSLMPILVMGLFFRLAGPQSPWWIRPLVSFVTGQLAQKVVTPRLKNHTRILESHLGGVKWFAGGLNATSADFDMIFPLECIIAGKSEGSTKNIKEYVDMVHERPAYKRALEKGGKYSLSFA